MSSNTEIQAKLETIAAVITDADYTEAGYDRWVHFETMCDAMGIVADGGMQDEFDVYCAGELFAEDGWSLRLEGGEWAVKHTPLPWQ